MSNKIWGCKIGLANGEELPDGADAPMRQAVQKAFRELTGLDDLFCFSGWGTKLDEHEFDALTKVEQDQVAPRRPISEPSPRPHEMTPAQRDALPLTITGEKVLAVNIQAADIVFFYNSQCVRRYPVLVDRDGIVMWAVD